MIDYVISLFITDQNSHITNTALTFPGHMSGVRAGSQVFVVNHFSGSTTKSATLGNNIYTVSLDPFTISRVHGSFHDEVGGDVFDMGTMTAFVNVHPVTAIIPEPSCLALASMGLGCLGAARLLRRRRRWPALPTP